MKINAKLHCGIKVLVDIAINSNENGVFQKDIAQRQSLSLKFLDHIVNGLKAVDLIRKVPGFRKGYTLTTDPSEITIYQVYRAFEPEMGIHPCLTCINQCPNINNCSTHIFLEKFNIEIRNYLEGTTIQQLKDIQIDLNDKVNAV